jgi:DNA-directed RNA polymerase subunit K/omega
MSDDSNLDEYDIVPAEIDDDWVGGDDTDDEADQPSESVTKAPLAPEVIDDGSDYDSDSDDDEEDIHEEALIDCSSNPESKTYIEIRIPPHQRRTSSVLNEYEITNIKAIRATQIMKFRNEMIEIGDLEDPGKIAEREITARRCPLMVCRVVGTIQEGNVIKTFVEYWDPNEMIHQTTYT